MGTISLFTAADNVTARTSMCKCLLFLILMVSITVFATPVFCGTKQTPSRLKPRKPSSKQQTLRTQDSHFKAGSVMKNFIGMNFVWIPAGRFVMGIADNEPAKCTGRATPRHLVEITKGFWLGQYEVTQSEWGKIMGRNPARFKGLKRPVEMVTWLEAVEFCKKMSVRDRNHSRYRLPTEAEWEYACRAGTTSATYNGELLFEDLHKSVSKPFNLTYFRRNPMKCPTLEPIAWYQGNSGTDNPLDAEVENAARLLHGYKWAGTQLVGQKRPNPWKLFDMLGNVREWCLDWHSPFYYRNFEPYYAGKEKQKVVTDPKGPKDSKGSYKIARGGSWNLSPIDATAGTRGVGVYAKPSEHIGFRVLLEHR